MRRLGEASKGKAWLASGLVVVAFGVLTAVRAPIARADTTVTVNTTDDENVPDDQKCALSEAAMFLSGVAEPDCGSARSGTTTIIVPAGCYRISQTLSLDQAVILQGAGPGPADCSGGGTVIKELGAQQVVTIGDADATLTGVTITGGHPQCRSAGDPFCNGGGVISAGVLTLRNDLVTNNAASAALDSTRPGGVGGGIYTFPGSPLTVESSTISDNRAGNGAAPGGGGGYGGGIFVDGGHLALTHSAVTGNSAGAGGHGSGGTAGGPGGSGGGIAGLVGSVLTIERSTISANNAGGGGAGGDGLAGGAGGPGGYGGGIVAGDAATISDSTMSGNVAGAGGSGGSGTVGSGGTGGNAGNGGGIHSQGASLTLTNDTLTGNAAGTAGAGGGGRGGGGNGGGGLGGNGGATDLAATTTTMRNVTIAGNSSTAFGGGGGVGGGGALVETASIIAGNDPQNCASAPTDGGGNVVFGDNTCPGPRGDPKLGALADNGGPTQTMALRAGSPAIDITRAANCATSDQRGVVRPQGAACDAGAYEFAPPTISAASAVATGPTTATVTAGVTAKLRDTVVLVRYGTTTAYGSTSATGDTGAANDAAPASVQLTGLTPLTSYHAQLVATNADGTSRSADLTFTTPAAATGGAVRPLISGVHQSAARWVEGSALARISRRHRLPVGTTFTFTLNEAARVTFTFSRTASGRKVGRRCVSPTRRNARRPRCRRTVIEGAFAFAAHIRVNTVRFYGQLIRGRGLPPGRWTLTIAALAPSGLRSAGHRLSFTIVGHR